MFNQNTSQVCQQIVLNDDALSELIEGFQVSLTPLLPRVSAGPRAQVTIIDGDSQ